MLCNAILHHALQTPNYNFSLLLFLLGWLLTFAAWVHLFLLLPWIIFLHFIIWELYMCVCIWTLLLNWTLDVHYMYISCTSESTILSTFYFPLQNSFRKVEHRFRFIGTCMTKVQVLFKVKQVTRIYCSMKGNGPIIKQWEWALPYHMSAKIKHSI